MSLIPEEELHKNEHLNLAPLVDFLFLVIAVLAIFAASRAALYNTEVNLVKLKPGLQDALLPPYEEPHVVILTVTAEGHYKWIFASQEILLSSSKEVQEELRKQQALGFLPHAHENTKVMLYIDKTAQWQSVADLIFAVKEVGFPIYPIYEQDSKS